MFSVRFLDRKGPLGRGEIVIDDFREKFETNLEYWTTEQYEEHWLSTLQGITSRETKAALVSSVTDPRTANFLFCWPIYRKGQTVFIQNQVIMLDEVRSQFSLERLGDFVPKHESVNDDGSRISEWRTTVQDVAVFLRSASNTEM